MYIYGLILFCTIFFYDFSMFDFWVCMIFLGLCSCVFLMGLYDFLGLFDFLGLYDFLDLTWHFFLE